jgi:hypothetical protein
MDRSVDGRLSSRANPLTVEFKLTVVVQFYNAAVQNILAGGSRPAAMRCSSGAKRTQEASSPGIGATAICSGERGVNP